MKQWIGRSLIGISILHSAFGLWVFRDALFQRKSDGALSFLSEMSHMLVMWFLLFGAALFLLGLAVMKLEQALHGELPKSLGWGLLILALTGIVLMPASGFWLALPPAFAILLRRQSNPSLIRL
ncbi:DUF6463 family protein [Chromobacterium sp. IIBBL 290-4]|uniref:DUF6463 family protein n=1 Tax=Chromobacterium sp. IIBBL 290-4 TaxID=2953890 RepID=UPI0020B691A3|nr:DUF6463 family protein [Chromobacterium sp. IIBBL 290-4]UTH72777.1 DUF6463 family protein [Chromobacterium sp. IIBBL 290-4]